MTDFSGIHSHYTGLPGFGLALTRCDGQSVLPRHQHEDAFLSFVFQGAYAEGQGSHMLDCKTNHITWHPPRDAHEVHHGSDSVTSLQVSFETRNVEGVDLCAAFSNHRATAHVPGLRSLMNEIRWELKHTDPFTSLNLRALILRLLAGLAREFRSLSANPGGRNPAEYKRLVDHHVEAAFPLAPDFGQLARELGLSQAQLVRLYHQASGESPVAAARRFRLSQAIELLRETALPLAQVAVDAGYYDQSHLTRELVRHTGCTPAVYRKHHH